MIFLGNRLTVMFRLPPTTGSLLINLDVMKIVVPVLAVGVPYNKTCQLLYHQYQLGMQYYIATCHFELV